MIKMIKTNNILDKSIYKSIENLDRFCTQNSKKAVLNTEKTIIIRKNLNFVDQCLKSVQTIFSKKQEYFNPISDKYDWVEVAE